MEKLIKYRLNQLKKQSTLTKNENMITFLNSIIVDREVIIFNDDLINIKISYTEIDFIFYMVMTLFNDINFKCVYDKINKRLFVMKKEFKDLVLVLPYGKRENYIDFIDEINKNVGDDGMVMMAVNNIPYNLSVILVVKEIHSKIEKFKILADKNNIKYDDTVDLENIIFEIQNYRKYNVVTLLKDTTKEEIKKLLNTLCFFKSELELEKSGYKTVVNHHKIFFSYSYKDKEIVYEFEKECLKRNINIWIDKNEIDYGDSINELINKGINECKLFLVFVSKNTLNSKYAKHELDLLYLKMINSKNEKIIIIKLDDVNLDEIFSGLTTRKYLDFTNKEEVNRFLDTLQDRIKKNY